MTFNWGRLRYTGPICGASALAVAVVAAGSSPAQAACTPAASSGITAICSGSTLNQGGASPGGTDGQGIGYGTGNEVGITVNVTGGADVTGSSIGLFFQSATISNASGATISGGTFGVLAITGPSDITNAGTISGGLEAIHFNGVNNTLTLEPGSSIVGTVLAPAATPSGSAASAAPPST